MKEFILRFDQIDRAGLLLVGGKGTNLGEMTRAGFPVPDGFCVTTEGFNAFIRTSPLIEELYRQLDEINSDDLDAIARIGEAFRNHLRKLSIPTTIQEEVMQAWRELGEDCSYAVRSSATAEDLPGASFAGQQETYLNVIGLENLLGYIRLCWSSLFTDRAIAYRIKNGFNHRKVALSVVVQKMVFPEVSGILFTADPISGNRNILTIDAGYGLGEALVSGIVSADLYKVKEKVIFEKIIGDKKLAVYGLAEGGTEIKEVTASKAKEQALADKEILRLAELGRRIEHHYGSPQDIEWCYAEGKIYILQSRPVTTLYPIPEVSDPDFLHILFSFGHQQMMTEALKPLAVSVLRTFFPFGKKTVSSESRFMSEAGGRLFIDVTYLLHMSLGRKVLPKGIGNIDDKMSKAVIEFVSRPDFQAGIKNHSDIERNTKRNLFKIFIRVIKTLFFADVKKLLPKINSFVEKSNELSKEQLADLSGSERIRKAREILGTFPLKMFFEVFYYAITGVISLKILENLLKRWLGGSSELQLLSKAFNGNITTDMGLELGDLAETARLYPEVVSCLRRDCSGDLYSELQNIKGGTEFLAELERFMDKYGMRCAGEIDITNPRWREEPSQLISAILSHIDSSKPFEHRKRFNEGEGQALEAKIRVLQAAGKTPGGWIKKKLLSRLIKVYRNTMVLREHPKYIIINQFDICRKAILEEGTKLWNAGVISDITDLYFLSLKELEEVLSAYEQQKKGIDENFLLDGQSVKLGALIAKRREKYESDRLLNPPRVITSEGEILKGVYRTKDLPEGALPGQPVSSGIVEGRARIILKPGEGRLNKGEILVAPFTDPGWTPLFISASGLVMEVGGLMTHGAVVAREYGIPSVVGVDDATQKIKNGQIIRVNGDLGYVEILK